RYRWSAETERRLIELNAHGGTLGEAARVLVEAQLRRNDSRTGLAAELLIGALLMGLEDTMERITGKLEPICRRDGGFSSLTEGLNHLNRIIELELTDKEKATRQIKALIGLVYQRAVSLIEELSHTPPEQAKETIDHLKTLYLIQNRYSFCEGELLADRLFTLIESSRGNSTLTGAACGLLYGMNRVTNTFAVEQAEAYLFGSESPVQEAGNFLTGLFSTARDILLSTEALMDGITLFLEKLTQEEFLNILPPLRYAFSFFTPRETDSIARKAAVQTGKLTREERPGSPSREVIEQTELDVTARLKNWGIL
ncbi:MAG: DUF5682 family protein, partial [Spirochaetales bacterium]|nr:DUF5682 family protein [Spirochaetales bacterium]